MHAYMCVYVCVRAHAREHAFVCVLTNLSNRTQQRETDQLVSLLKDSRLVTVDLQPKLTTKKKQDRVFLAVSFV